MTTEKRVKEILKNGEFAPAKTRVAKVLAKALRVHPAVIVFPGWEVGHAS